MSLSVLNILSVALNETPKISAFPGFCKRVRFRKSNCQRCVEICPENVISLNPGPTINNGCSNCDLCLNVCPTEVFQNNIYTDQYLINQGKSFLGKGQRQGGKKRLSIHCHQAENQNEHSLSIPCLGRITENIILGVVLSGFDEVELRQGLCSQCRFRQGEKLLKNSIVASRILLESMMGLGCFTMGIKEKEKKNEAMLSRREIFSKISSKVKDQAESFVYQKVIREKLTGDPENKKTKWLSPKRELLKKLLRQKGWENSTITKYNPELPWGKIKMDEKNCSACGICLALCPTGAISKKLEDGCHFLYFNSSLCTNCSLCKEACPENSIDLVENFFLSDIFEDRAKIVARIKLTSCMICGEILAAGKGEFCPTCQKRQVWPMQLKT